MPSNKQRREAARRHVERQLQRREEQEAARRRFTLIASIVGSIIMIVLVTVFVVVLTREDKKTPAAAGGTSPAPSTAPGTPRATAAPLPLGTCEFVAGGQAAKKVIVPPDKAPTNSGLVLARVGTTQGTLTFALDPAKAPCAVANFLSLARQGYYDNSPCHRLVTSGLSVLQCGDPTGTGSGGPGYTFNDEVTGKEKYTAGVLAMAKTSAPNTAGSQFFIVYKDTQLPPDYTIFGKVERGLDVVTKVAAKGSTPAGDGKPKLPITITSVSIAQ
ncbi:MAG: peptidylprolyl isomerase [Pseudonocardiales bacterium]|nr:MAG: peptidylprolyl isomerase [Pseudonocardiales bacterium]